MGFEIQGSDGNSGWPSNGRPRTLVASAGAVSLGGEMANQIGEHYVCSNPDCGCEVEIVLPCGAKRGSGRSSAGVTEKLSPDVFTPPSRTMPREGPSLVEGAGERTADYGSRKVENELPGAFRDEGETEPGATAETAGERSTKGGYLLCFCGSLMVLADARSSAARLGRGV